MKFKAKKKFSKKRLRKERKKELRLENERLASELKVQQQKKDFIIDQLLNM